MAPGATNNPEASKTWAASLLCKRPILAIFPLVMPRSARYRGKRVPSIMVPFLMMVSNVAITPPFIRVMVTASLGGRVCWLGAAGFRYGQQRLRLYGLGDNASPRRPGGW